MNLKNCFSILILLTLTFTYSSCKSQGLRIVGGPCEGCEALYEYQDKILKSVDTLPEFDRNEPKMKITGIVYEKDGKTPAENVIIYIYHTNRKGVYQMRGDEIGWAKRHGYIRGWVKTGKDGKYTFYSFRPASYPDETEPEHIHITIKEPETNEYYLDEYFFADDPLLKAAFINKLPKRGGSGVVNPSFEAGMLTIKRDIILGMNIPDYEK
ncbi:intradiol ring-cleavage dioxygenase [Sphingobacterium sp. WM]|uniref:dioxygenase family protein n=1 Tax=Sphingobacterium sp. WM TaxID=3031802 RepID=UPI00240E7122|nr:intradiol ring-cleavage dioxygenase [Sphingobacterium sp. WM]WFB62267.1 intradiol ring-cleavage dioxygenase [Sphingobacterium sp. WM]